MILGPILGPTTAEPRWAQAQTILILRSGVKVPNPGCYPAHIPTAYEANDRGIESNTSVRPSLGGHIIGDHLEGETIARRLHLLANKRTNPTCSGTANTE